MADWEHPYKKPRRELSVKCQMLSGSSMKICRFIPFSHFSYIYSQNNKYIDQNNVKIIVSCSTSVNKIHLAWSTTEWDKTLANRSIC